MFGLKTKLIKGLYRKKNRHNFTEIKGCIDISKINVGKGTYGIIDAKTYGGKGCNLVIGNYCSIANDVVFILGGEHNYKNISTYPFKAKFLKESDYRDNGDIILEDDVWIGYGCTILSGVKIGQGAVVGAKSVVAKDIPPYAIFCGNQIIKYRFSDNVIKKLLKIKFSEIDSDFIKNNIKLLYSKVDENLIDEILVKLEQKGSDKN